MEFLSNTWDTIRNIYTIVITVIVIYDHWDKVRDGLAWIGDRLWNR